MADALPNFNETQPIAENAALPSFDETQPALPSFDQTKDVPEEVSEPQESHEIKYGPPGALSDTAFDTPPEQVGAGLEGAAKGVAGPIATGLELGAHKLGLDSAIGIDTSAEAQKQREETYPGTSATGQIGAMTGSLIAGAGLPALIAKGAKTGMALAGAKLLTPLVEGMAFQASDEASKALLGQGDPEEAVGPALVRMGGAGLLNAFTHGVFSGLGKATTKGLAAVENAKLGDRAEQISAGLGAGAKAHAAGVPLEDAEGYLKKYYQDMGAGDAFNYNEYKDGVKLYYKGLQKTVRAAADTIGGVIGGIPGVLVTDQIVLPLAETVLQKPLVRASKYIAPVIVRAMEQGQTSGLFNAINHANNVAAGAKAINSGVNSLFKAGGQRLISDEVSDKDAKAIKDYISGGGITQEMQDSLQQGSPPEQQQYAKGGEVQPQSDSGSLSSLYPEQSTMMSAAKGRMSNYLNSLKPQDNPQKLPYDRAPDQKEQHKTYNEAVDIAANPMSVLKHIKSGGLQMDHMKHLNSMYPELTQHLQKKITKRMMESQLDDEQPKGRVKQAMALFLGAPLETYQTPQGIMAAQAIFAPKQPSQPQGKPAGSTKKGTTNLGKSNKSYQTPEQAAENYKSNRK